MGLFNDFSFTPWRGGSRRGSCDWQDSPPLPKPRRFVDPTISRGGNDLGPVVVVYVPKTLGKDRILAAHQRVFGKSPTRLCDWGKQFAVGLAVRDGDMEHVESRITAFDTALSQVPA